MFKLRSHLATRIVVCFTVVIFCGVAFTHVGLAQKIQETVTIVDEKGREVEVPCSPQRIVSLNSYISELLCAFQVEDRIAGRTDLCMFPPVLKEKPSMGRSWVRPNLELLFEQRPDLVIADPCFKAELREKVENAGIPVILLRGYDIDSILYAIENLGRILDKEDRAKELAGFITRYRTTINKRIEALAEEEKPLVYFEDGRGAYHTVALGSSSHKRLVEAGAVNIAGGEPVKFPVVSAEWVLQKNPDIIVREVYPGRLGVNVPTPEVMEEVRNEIITRPGLKEVRAVKEGRVYIICSRLFTGLRSVVGLSYLAKWFHPELFADLKPTDIHREMLEKFHGLKLEGAWVYPPEE